MVWVCPCCCCWSEYGVVREGTEGKLGWEESDEVFDDSE